MVVCNIILTNEDQATLFCAMTFQYFNITGVLPSAFMGNMGESINVLLRRLHRVVGVGPVGRLVRKVQEKGLPSTKKIDHPIVRVRLGKKTFKSTSGYWKHTAITIFLI